ncbi:MAG: glucose-1-phosphate thymidylyltransferase [Candidatus Bipolaricaulia bacterium]
MKAVVLCAGKGIRLRPLTHTGAKHLIPVANKPVIEYNIEALQDAGIEEVGIVVSPNVEDEFTARLGDGSRWGVRIHYILQRDPKGLAHAVACVEEFVGDEPFLVYLGDNLLENGVRRFIDDFNASDAHAAIVLYEVNDPSRFGVAEIEDGQIVRLVEKPEQPRSNQAIIGVYLFDRNIFPAIEATEPSARGELEITDAIQRLIEEGHQVIPYSVEGWWIDTGGPEDVLHANQLILEQLTGEIHGQVQDSSLTGRVVVAEGTKIVDSKLRGPIKIGPDVHIERSFIGPFTSIDRGTVIRNSEVEYSIVMEASRIENVVGRIDHSLIGRNVQIGRKTEPPEAYQLILGDNSCIRLI